MAFWRFGFHSQSAIDSILSSSTLNQHAHSNPAYSTPSTSNHSMLLDKLLEEDDLLQEIKAQHPKLIEFLGTRQVVSRMLAYISGAIFDDEDSDQTAETPALLVDRLLSVRSPNSTESGPSGGGGGSGNFLSSFRNRVVGDSIGALLMEALDSEGRTPEDRAKAERRRIRFPYLSTEIIASDLWTVTSQIFSDSPRWNLLTRFWDAVLDQPPSATATKSVQMSYWAKANIALINSKPNEMIAFVKSYPNLIPKLLTHFNSSPIVDILIRIIQCEETVQGTIDWLIDSTDFVELVISLLHPSRPPELHLITADFLKDVIAYCTNHPPPNQSTLNPPAKGLPTGSPPPSTSEPSALTSASSDLPSPSSGGIAESSSPLNPSEEHPKMTTTRLMRELSSPPVVSKLLSFGLDTPISEDDDVITKVTLASSLINALSVLIDLIRRNNSDYSEHQLMLYFRDHPLWSQSDNSSQLSSSAFQDAPRVVPLNGLLDAIGNRLADLQALIKSPNLSIHPKPMVIGPSFPLTLERFRIIELYAELLHCSNMGLVNRNPSEGPKYDDDGAIINGLDALIAMFEASNINGSEDSNIGSTTESLNQSTPLKEESDHCEEPQTRDVMLDEEKSAKVGASIEQEPAKAPEVPAGVRMKELFIEYKIFDTCFDLFFEFPWNNFLHNVIYDIVQQTLNAKFSNFNNRNANLKLALSLFQSTNVVDRLLNGLEINQKFGLESNNVRLGNMGHLVLIGDELLKVLETNPNEFQAISESLSKDERWQYFVDNEINEARKHSSLPLGGTMPIAGTVDVRPAEPEDKQIASSSNRGKWKKNGSKKDEDDSDEHEHEEVDIDEEWDSNRMSRKGFDHSGGGMSGSVISNPTPFGFDDRFDAPSRSFPQRFPDSSDNFAFNGFDDDFGSFEGEEVNITLKPGSSHEKQKQEEEEWGEFSGPATEDESEARWNDFDLKVDEAKPNLNSNEFTNVKTFGVDPQKVKSQDGQHRQLEVEVEKDEIVKVPTDEILTHG
ncbi:hypothetical protein O181_060775 [Austropuccinia psidii MF-1]|uniref:Uncharacterized protein n=1 Tax=Austropuccinia psidii MF-1 TaxID=1389203 RepID=A0A9Q3EL37_9BASI|nr:hypothetical protein [Austropuccinia psidii MF-1]